MYTTRAHAPLHGSTRPELGGQDGVGHVPFLLGVNIRVNAQPCPKHLCTVTLCAPVSLVIVALRNITHKTTLLRVRRSVAVKVPQKPVPASVCMAIVAKWFKTCNRGLLAVKCG